MSACAFVHVLMWFLCDCQTRCDKMQVITWCTVTFTILNLTDPKSQVAFGIGLDLKQNCNCLLKQKGRLVFAFLCWSKYWYSGSENYVIVDNWTEDCTLFVKTVSLQSCTLHCTAHTHNQDVLISVKHSVPSNIQMTEHDTDCIIGYPRPKALFFWWHCHLVLLWTIHLIHRL